MRYKKGDTLIEVTLAVGIFSMIAIAIVAVMNNGTSSAQTALETTLAREEIDAQAEALRFIQASYVASKSTDADGTGNFARLWQTIADHAIDLTQPGLDKNAVLNYAPTSCNALYNKGTDGSDSLIVSQKAFVINTHALGDYVGLDASAFDTANKAAAAIGKVYVPATTDNNTKLIYTPTYPRLVFQSTTGETTDEATLASEDFPTDLYKAEGIYVIAVKDSGTTNIISDASAAAASAFYDFYIRTCWYGSNANEPSTISTVIRLYDPAIVKSPAT